MKKIAIFSNDLSVGGIQKSLYNIIRNIDLDKYELDIYLMKNNNFYQDNISQKVNIYYLKKHSNFIKLIPFLLLKIFIPYEGLKKEYDIAIDFDSYQPITALNAIKCNAKEKVMWIHSNWLEKLKYEKKFKIAHFFSKRKTHYFDKFVGVSKGVIKPFADVNRLSNINYEIIPNIIDTKDILKKSEEKCDLLVDQNKYNFCSVGSVVISKGFDILINNLYELKKYRQDFHFYLIGDGPEMANIKALANKLMLDDVITFLGYQQNPYKYMKKMDGFILTSRYEGQGMVLLEAQSLGLDIFMTKNLEQYNENLKGYKNILLALKKAKKGKKVINDLEDYNNNVIKKLESLFDS